MLFYSGKITKTSIIIIGGNSQWSTPWELVMAGCVIVTLPLNIVFFIFQDQFMRSVTIGAVKE